MIEPPNVLDAVLLSVPQTIPPTAMPTLMKLDLAMIVLLETTTPV